MAGGIALLGGMGVLIELCRIEITGQGARQAAHQVLIELCRIEIDRTDIKNNKFKGVLIELCRIEIPMYCNVCAVVFCFNRTL